MTRQEHLREASSERVTNQGKEGAEIGEWKNVQRELRNEQDPRNKAAKQWKRREAGKGTGG